MNSATPVPSFDSARCDGCGTCVALCPEHVLLMAGDPPRPFFREEVDCTYCGICEASCPKGAVLLTYEIVLG
jgi:ferredoxin